MRGSSGTTGYIPVSDASGVMTWTDPTTLGTLGVTGAQGQTGNQGITGAQGSVVIKVKPEQLVIRGRMETKVQTATRV